MLKFFLQINKIFPEKQLKFLNHDVTLLLLSKQHTNELTSSILCQCLSFIALLAIISRRGQVSLKSSIFFFKSLNALYSFTALGSLRHLFWKSRISLLIFSMSTYRNDKLYISGLLLLQYY